MPTAGPPFRPQAHRAVLPQLPCRVVAAVPQEELAAVPWACQEDPRRTAKFMSYALTAAAEASAVGWGGWRAHVACSGLRRFMPPRIRRCMLAAAMHG